MDCDTAGYKQAGHAKVCNEMKSMLVKVGWRKEIVEKSVPFCVISGWMGDNLLKPMVSAGKLNIGWWKGVVVENAGEKIMSMSCTISSTSCAVCQSDQPVPQ